jgi:exo-beta-1,3-glucanase (GH17 family)
MSEAKDKQSQMGVNYSNTFQATPATAEPPYKGTLKIADSAAADLVKASSIKHVKLFNYSQVKFFDKAATDGFMLYPAVPNVDLAALAAGTNTTAIVDALKPYAANLGAVFVGNEPLINDAATYGPLLVKALNNLSEGFTKAGMDVKLSVPFNAGTQTDTWPPSSAKFKSNLKTYVEDVCAFLQVTNSFFTINIYPFYANLASNTDNPLDYCLFQKKTAQFTDPVSKLPYLNLFDAEYDATYFALKDLSTTQDFELLPIVVGETGWPTGGATRATADYAKEYNQGLIDHVNSGVGSPKLPGREQKTFIFELYDEKGKDIAAGPFELDWGWHNGGEVITPKTTGDTAPTGDYTKKYALKWDNDLT